MHFDPARLRARTVATLGASALVATGLVATTATTAQAVDPVCSTTEYATFDNVPAGELTLNGDAAIVGPAGSQVLRLTPTQLGQAGSSFTTQKVSFLNDGSFSSAFSFRMTDQYNGGADGIVFVVQNVANSVGTAGGGIGYQGLPTSVGVEFDNWYNGGFDINDNHVGIDVNGDITSDPTATLYGVLDLDNASVTHRAWVDYNGVTDSLEVRVSDTATRPATAILTKAIDIPATLGGVTEAFVGFTSATGEAAATHDIVNWTLTNCYQPIDAPPTVSPGGPYTGPEGSPVPLSGTVTDDGTATSMWSYVVDSAESGASCAFADDTSSTTTVTCTDDGTYTLTLTGDDGVSDPVAVSTTLTVGNVAPVVSSVTPAFTSACAVTVDAAFADDGTNDTHTASIAWGDGSSGPATVTESGGAGSGTASHTYGAAGTYSIVATVTDDDNGVGTGGTTVTTKNTPSAFGAPINAGGDRSVFRLGSTIPVKITVTDCSGNLVTTLSPTVQLDKVDSFPAGPVNEPMVDEVPTNGKAMAWNGEHYQYNLSTKRSEFFDGASLVVGTYRLTVTDASLFVPATVHIDLR
jgi:hypothetical protein